jgi:hypothetical protein
VLAIDITDDMAKFIFTPITLPTPPRIAAASPNIKKKLLEFRFKRHYGRDRCCLADTLPIGEFTTCALNYHYRHTYIRRAMPIMMTA